MGCAAKHCPMEAFIAGILSAVEPLYQSAPLFVVSYCLICLPCLFRESIRFAHDLARYQERCLVYSYSLLMDVGALSMMHSAPVPDQGHLCQTGVCGQLSECFRLAAAADAGNCPD